MPEIHVVLLVKLTDVSPYQEVEFLKAMRDQRWQHLDSLDGLDGLYATFPDSFCDSEVVNQSERDLRRAATRSAVETWDAVCLVNDDQPLFLTSRGQPATSAECAQESPDV